MSEAIQYSARYHDDKYEFRHVTLPTHLAKILPPTPLLAEHEWRSLGIQQSRGWIHYGFHQPERHILLFRRELGAPAAIAAAMGNNINANANANAAQPPAALQPAPVPPGNAAAPPPGDN